MNCLTFVYVTLHAHAVCLVGSPASTRNIFMGLFHAGHRFSPQPVFLQARNARTEGRKKFARRDRQMSLGAHSQVVLHVCDPSVCRCRRLSRRQSHTLRPVAISCVVTYLVPRRRLNYICTQNLWSTTSVCADSDFNCQRNLLVFFCFFVLGHLNNKSAVSDWLTTLPEAMRTGVTQFLSSVEPAHSTDNSFMRIRIQESRLFIYCYRFASRYRVVLKPYWMLDFFCQISEFKKHYTFIYGAACGCHTLSVVLI